MTHKYVWVVKDLDTIVGIFQDWRMAQRVLNIIHNHWYAYREKTKENIEFAEKYMTRKKYIFDELPDMRYYLKRR